MSTWVAEYGDYLSIYGAAVVGFAFGWLFRGLLALRDVRALEIYEARDRARVA